MRSLVAALVAVTALALSCGSGTPSAQSPGTALTGTVIARAEGFSSRPGWAEPARAWSRDGDTLVVVGYARVRGDQNREMAFRASDSYARAELLQFLSVRVVAVLLDEETSGSAASAQDRRTLEERVTTHSEAIIDDWFVSGRYWEKRSDDGDETLHVFSRLEVDRAKVEELLAAATQEAQDLRLPRSELSRRLASSWQRLAEVSEQGEHERELLSGVRPPDWAAAGDKETNAEFSFVCHARASDEKTAEALAKARCNEKLCRLFGVRISARTTVKESLDALSAESEVTEQCEDVRAAGRRTSNKSAECTDEGCIYWVRQTYPRAAYEAELQRQKEPTVIRQQVVIQEGGVKYRDPAECERSLRSYSAVEGQKASAYEARLLHLNAAMKSCQGIDGRDSGLFSSLNLLLTKPTAGFIFSKNSGGDLRSAFASVTDAWHERLATERFLVTRIQMVRDVVRDAIFPMKLIDAVDSRTSAEVSSAAFEQLVSKAITIPLADARAIPTHRANPHVILLGIYHTRMRSSATYRAFVLRALQNPAVNCDRPDVFDAEQLAAYLRFEGDGVDDEEYRALLSAYKRAPARQMDRCISHLLDEKKLPESVRARRVRELAALAVDGTLRRPERADKPAQERPNVYLFEHVLRAATPTEKLELYTKYEARLTGAKERDELAEKITAELFGGMKQWIGRPSVERTPEQTLAHCRSLTERFRQARAGAKGLPVTSTDACECLSLSELQPGDRAKLVELWTKETDRACKHLKTAEWPGGHADWPYAKRRWDAPNGTPLRQAPQVLRKEYQDCGYAAGIHSLRFTPMLKATLTGRKLTKVAISTQLDGTLSRMTKRDDSDAMVRQSDVLRAREKFDACFRAAAEGYEVAADQLQETPAQPRKVWLEFGDQGVSHGYE